MSELGDVLELMHTSEQRWRSLRAAGREWRHEGLHLEAFMRMVERRRPGSTATLRASTDEVDGPAETEHPWGLWMEGGRRIRAEFAFGHGETVIAVVDGRTWWNWSPSMGARTNAGSENAETGLGPGIALVHPAQILPGVELQVRGRTQALGRPAYEVTAVPTEDEHEGQALLHGLGSGAEAYTLLVDAERGVLLRSEARLHERPFYVLEMGEVAFDETLPAGTFVLEPPTGAEFEEIPRSRSLLLEQLPDAVSFTVLVPERAPDDAEVRVMIEQALPEYGVPEYADIVYETFDMTSPPTFVALRESAEPMPKPDKTGWREIEGLAVGEDRHTEPPTIRVRLETHGTHVEISSRDLSVDRLLIMARSLVPLPSP